MPKSQENQMISRTFQTHAYLDRHTAKEKIRMHVVKKMPYDSVNQLKILHEWWWWHWWSSLSDCYPLNPIDLWHQQKYPLLFKPYLLVATASTWLGLWSVSRQHSAFPNNGEATFSHSCTFSCASMLRSSFPLFWGFHVNGDMHPPHTHTHRAQDH